MQVSPSSKHNPQTMLKKTKQFIGSAGLATIDQHQQNPHQHPHNLLQSTMYVPQNLNTIGVAGGIQQYLQNDYQQMPQHNHPGLGQTIAGNQNLYDKSLAYY